MVAVQHRPGRCDDDEPDVEVQVRLDLTATGDLVDVHVHTVRLAFHATVPVAVPAEKWLAPVAR